MAITNTKIDEGAFFEERKQVLGMWETGSEVDLEEAVAYHKKMPAHKNLVHQLQNARKSGRALIHNLSGYTTLEQQIDLQLALQNEGQSDFLHCIYDSLTRTCRFDLATKYLREAERTGKNMLNGFPVVSYGVKGCRKITDAVDRPISACGPSIDSRLASEIALASGYSELVINTFVAFETYTKTVPLEDIMRYHQYACRLVGYYQERGVSLGVLVPAGAGGDNAPGIAPPSLGTSCCIIGALMTAAQGPKHLVFFNPSHGNLVQDVATSVTRAKVIREYLDRFGFTDTEIYIENGNMGGQYPQDYDKAFAEVMYAGAVSAFSGSELCQIKTFDETSGIPTKENQIRSLRGTRMMYNILKTPKFDFTSTPEVKEEAHEEEIETRAIVDKTLELGDGDPLAGAVKAYELGVIDNPVANNPRVVTKAIGVKDAYGAVRYLHTGNLPFTKEMTEFHRAKIEEREKRLGHSLNYDTIVSDMRALANGTWLSS